MEDSYTVHRRRKAAARKREKTPEPPKRRPEDVTETDDDEDARARMERMVQETEALEEMERIRTEKAVKSSENIEKSAIAENKPERSMKRAMSPEMRQDAGKLATKSSIDATKRDKIEKLEKERSALVKKTSGTALPETQNQQKDSTLEETPRKSRKDENDTIARGAVSRRRRDLEKEFSPETLEKPGRISRKGLSPDSEKLEKNSSDNETLRSGERNRETGGSVSTKKSISSRAADEIEQAAATVLLDENRYEATRETDAAGPAKSIGGKSLKNETPEHRNSRKNDTDEEIEKRSGGRTRETLEKSLKSLSEDRARKRDVISPSKSRNFEPLVTSASKRTSKDRNIERKIGYTTDSSDPDEVDAKRLSRRKNKSPEGAKIRLRSTSGKKISSNISRSRPTTDTDGDPEERQEPRKKSEKKVTSRRRTSSETEEDTSRKDQPRNSSSYQDNKEPAPPRASSRQTDRSRTDEKRLPSRSRHSNDEFNSEDPKTITKSETFPSLDSTRSNLENTSSIAAKSLEMKKQIIPLSDDSLVEDFERAQRDYIKKERGILDPDPMDNWVDPRMEAAFRRRKLSIIQKETEQSVQQVQQVPTEKKSWFSWLPFFGKKAKKEMLDDKKDAEDEKIKEDVSLENKSAEVPMKKEKDQAIDETKILDEETSVGKKVSFLEFFRAIAHFASEFRAFVEQNPRESRKIRILRNRCIAELLLAIIYCGLGAFIFRFTEGAFETFYKCGVKRVKRDFLDSLWNFSHNLREEDWKSMARRKLMEFEEQLHTAHEAGVHSYSGQKSWSFLNAVVYCLTVITTIGYGHISPSTTTGRAITIVYAIFGIPMFLIILADFGKLFTRGIKFLWAFVRRVYYTGSCRRVRRTVPVQEVMKGVQLVYDLATFRRPSQMNPEEIEEMEKQQNQTQTVLNLDGNAPPPTQPGTPGTPALSTFAIDDEFNLPISVAIIILLVYIFVGATVYNFWEQWGFFESFYFVFISMSTIGFGDYVPKHPIYMMLSIVYLVFGLALTSMCINVVQVMLSDSFKQASQKISATIGFEVAEDDGSGQEAAQPTVETADVHATIKESESEEQVAPKAKQEDVEL